MRQPSGSTVEGVHEGGLASVAVTASATSEDVLQGATPRAADVMDTAGASPLRRIIGRVYPAGSSTRALAIRGTFWTVVMFGAGQVIGLLTNIGLAAVLAPAAFGVMLLVKVVIQGLKMFSDIGIGPSIIQNQRGEDPVFLNTAWTLQIIRGLGLWLGAVLLAWPAARFFGDAQLAPLLIATGLGAVIAGFHSPALFSLNRRLQLGLLNSLNLAALVIGNTVMLALAWITHSVWSIVIGGLVSASVLLSLSHRAIPQPRARIMWDPDCGRQLIKFGKWIFISTMITFLAAQADKLILGRLLTLDELGVYGVATTVATFPASVAGALAASVLYPVLSSHFRNSSSKLGPKVLQARGLILPIGAAASLSVVAGAPVLFGYVYPPAFADAGWIAQLLMLPMWAILLQLSADRAVLAAGDSRSLAASNVWKLVLTVGGSVVGYAFFHLPGFIVGMTAGAVAGHIRVQLALARLDINILWQDLRYTGLFLALAAVAGVLPRMLTGAPWRQTPDLTAQLGAATLVLVPISAWTARILWHELARGKAASGHV